MGQLDDQVVLCVSNLNRSLSGTAGTQCLTGTLHLGLTLLTFRLIQPGREDLF